MADKAENKKDDSGEGTDSLVDRVSSLDDSALDEGSNRVNQFSLNVYREHLDRLACAQSVVTAADVVLDTGFGGKRIAYSLRFYL
jgi:hypothetical protein